MNVRTNKQIKQCQIWYHRCRRAFRSDRLRLSGGVCVSAALHAVVLGLLLGAHTIEKQAETPIRCIEFVDLTRLPEPKPASVPKRISKIHRQKATVQRTEKKETLPPPAAPIDLKGNGRRHFDMQRRQAPLALPKNNATRLALNRKDILKISPAHGTRRDKQVQAPAPIRLQPGRKVKLAVSTRQHAFRPAAAQSPTLKLSNKKSIDLAGRFMHSAPAPVRAAPPKKDFAALKRTRTIITGPLANRGILNKKVPIFPEWARRQGVGAAISLRFTVMENGRVKENVVVERTSGSQQWDRMVIEALKKWIFTRLAKTDIRQDQTGIITFQFVI